jgi:gluconolactonase
MSSGVLSTGATGELPSEGLLIAQSYLDDVKLVTEGLCFPEGPIALADGSVLVVEIERGTLTRVHPDGRQQVVAECGGGPNGAAIGPDHAVYICNNGGRWPNFAGGRIERVDLETGKVEVLYDNFDGRPLAGPNDLVFDRSGDFWFTVTGKFRDVDRDFGEIYHASPDGDHLVRAIERLDAPNGIGLSPDGGTLYFAESVTGRLYHRTITGRGEVVAAANNEPATLVCGLPGLHLFDSLAVDGEGNICVGTLVSGRITVIAPDGSSVRQYRLPPPFEDPMPTNLCFGGPDRRTAFLTLSETGRLVSCEWPVAGLALEFNR